MKKTIMFLGVLSLGLAQAQQNDPYTGKVGVNTETPTATLNVKSKTGTTASTKNLELENANGTKMLTVLNNGKVGVNTQPEYLVDINSIGNDYNSNSLALRVVSNTNWGGAFDIWRARGTSERPLSINKGDDLLAIHSRSYTGTKFLTNSKIGVIATGDITENNVPSSFMFETTNIGSKLNRIMTLHHTSNIAIGSDHTPKATLDIHANNNVVTDAQKKAGKNEVILLRNIHIAPVNESTKESKLSIAGGMHAFGLDYRSHSIDFGMIDLRTSTNPFMAFSVAPHQGSPSNQDMTVEHMRIMHTGNIGMGTTAPTHKLHIKADANPLKLEGLQPAGANAQNLVVENGVVKVGSTTSTGATQLSGTEGIECNEENRGKMNFKKDVPLASGGTTDAFGVCLKGSDGSFYWQYMYGSAGRNNGTGTFGTGLQ